MDEEWIDESGMEVEVTLGARSRTDGKAKLIQTFINLILYFLNVGKFLFLKEILGDQAGNPP